MTTLLELFEQAAWDIRKKAGSEATSVHAEWSDKSSYHHLTGGITVDTSLDVTAAGEAEKILIRQRHWLFENIGREEDITREVAVNLSSRRPAVLFVELIDKNRNGAKIAWDQSMEIVAFRAHNATVNISDDERGIRLQIARANFAVIVPDLDVILARISTNRFGLEVVEATPTDGII